MIFSSIITDYFRWHYTHAFNELFHVWLNLLWFVIHYFSLPQLMRSWFSPWKRITEERRDGWSFEAIASFVVINLLTRLVGGIIRTAVIFIGALFLCVTIVAGAVIHLLWIVLPLLITAFFILGISLLVSHIII